MEFLKLTGGKIYDPRNEIDGEARDLWIAEGKIVEAPQGEVTARVIDLQGRIVMPGGVDMHSHIAGPKVNMARKMQPDLFRAEDNPTLPTIYDTGYRYLGLGYTTAFDAAVTPSAAPHVIHELDDLPGVDSGFFILVGNNHQVFDCVANREPEKLRDFLGQLL